ncbi:MAG: histidinol-phosphate transaminase [Candidatus Omnitrophica bacterium]|nr:histidinol-phosphate transaminase [Candidatus Omnitrophota bacterium]
MSLARRNIQEISPYIAGKPIAETKRELGLKKVIKLASNENPFGASPKAVKAIKRCLKELNRYPDSNSFYLKKRIALGLEVIPSSIVVGNGSDELIDIVLKTFVEDGENIVTGDTTFLEYGIISKVYARQVIKVPLKDFRFDLEGIRDKINNKTKLVFIANPNNPTGTYVTKPELEKFLSGLPDNVIVVMDEAYDIFIDVPDYPSGADYIGKNNIIVLKTFSKAYGLAGLRVGFAVAAESLTAFMEKARQPFNVNLPAQEAALAALDDKAFLNKTRKLVLKGKKYLYGCFDRMSLEYIPSVTNFILVDLKKDGVTVFKDLLKQGVIVRDMQQYGLKNFVRITIGTAAENRKLIAALKKVL